MACPQGAQSEGGDKACPQGTQSEVGDLACPQRAESERGDMPVLREPSLSGETCLSTGSPV